MRDLTLDSTRLSISLVLLADYVSSFHFFFINPCLLFLPLYRLDELTF